MKPAPNGNWWPEHVLCRELVLFRDTRDPMQLAKSDIGIARSLVIEGFEEVADFDARRGQPQKHQPRQSSVTGVGEVLVPTTETNTIWRLPVVCQKSAEQKPSRFQGLAARCVCRFRPNFRDLFGLRLNL